MSRNTYRPVASARSLQAFLKTHWSDRYLWGAGTFDGRRKVGLDISTFMALQRIMEEMLKGPDWEGVDAALDHVFLFDDFLKSPRYAGNGKHLANLRSAVLRRDGSRSQDHLARLMRVVKPMAADRTFADDQTVTVKRTEHGWFDGRMSARVKPGSGGYAVIDDDGVEHRIMHLRDIS